MSLPPHLTQANTSKSNVLLSHSAKVHSRRPLLHPLRSGPCLLPRSRLLLTCLGDQKWPQFGAWSEDAVEPREVCPRHQAPGTPHVVTVPVR
ncbi:hypothetical protein D7X12_38330 [Corallococcus sicarius]|uniref:Uncharacterized protein n=1 Tax=Corallococcus sicarius TaxID=2316726 RepID=A0A3A8MIH4_9BACT|nr:hypothetical protein D7X12_38330 [Corallococcus sicarius]